MRINKMKLISQYSDLEQAETVQAVKESLERQAAAASSNTEAASLSSKAASLETKGLELIGKINQENAEAAQAVVKDPDKPAVNPFST